MGYCERKKEKIDAGFRLFIKFQSREEGGLDSFPNFLLLAVPVHFIPPCGTLKTKTLFRPVD